MPIYIPVIADTNELRLARAVTSPVANVAFVPLRYSYSTNAFCYAPGAAGVDGGV